MNTVEVAGIPVPWEWLIAAAVFGVVIVLTIVARIAAKRRDVL